VLTLGLEDGAGGTKRDTRNAVNLVKPGGFPEGVSAFFEHPGHTSSESGRETRKKARGRAILSWSGSDVARYSLYTTSLRLVQWVTSRFDKKAGLRAPSSV
jgi:hypothetical protein